MLAETDKELEQIQKLDKLRKLIQTILGGHLALLIIIFLLVLGFVLTFVILSVSYSSSRYLARLNLCYLPKQRGKISHYDDKYVLGILNRQTTRTNFLRRIESKKAKAASSLVEAESGKATKAGKKAGRKKLAAQKLMIYRDRKQPHNFTIQLNAASEADAVDLINEFASVCIEEYTKERTHDLRNWRTVLENERRDVNEKLQQCSNRISRLATPIHIVAPEKEYERIRIQLNEFQTARIRLSIVLENLSKRQKQLEAELAQVNPAVLTHQQEIKAFQAELDKLNQEVSISSEIYTEENPKMRAILSRRNAVQKRMDAFLESKKIKSFDFSLISQAEKLASEQKTLQTELESRKSEMRVLDSQIADCQKRFKAMTEYQPKLQQLTQQRKTLLESLERLDESISEIDYMLLMVKDDLFVNEKAISAVGNQPLAKKRMLISIFAALAITFFAATIIVLIEFFFGRVSGATELKLYDEFYYLGELPASTELIKSDALLKIILHKIFHNFHGLGLRLIFTDVLPGAKLLDQMFDFFEWNFAMSGRKVLFIKLVLAEDFTAIADPDSKTMIVTFSDGKCYLPLTSKKFFTPSEQELLKNDFQILKEEYDYIFLRNTSALHRSVLLLEQLTEFCDGLMVAVGAEKTPRKHLRKLLTVHLKIKLPVMTILTGYSSKHITQDLNQEADS